MYKIRLISCYFGELKSEFYLWLNSCGYNKTIDFLFVTDQEIIATGIFTFIVQRDIISVHTMRFPSNMFLIFVENITSML